MTDNSNQDTMRDVDHTSPVQEDVARVFARGGRREEESEDEE